MGAIISLGSTAAWWDTSELKWWSAVHNQHWTFIHVFLLYVGANILVFLSAALGLQLAPSASAAPACATPPSPAGSCRIIKVSPHGQLTVFISHHPNITKGSPQHCWMIVRYAILLLVTTVICCIMLAPGLQDTLAKVTFQTDVCPTLNIFSDGLHHTICSGPLLLLPWGSGGYPRPARVW